MTKAAIEPRGLRREDAAAYLGVSGSKFDDMVRDGRMPTPFRIDRCVVWDRHRLDAAMDLLSEDQKEPANEWDVVLDGGLKVALR